MVEDVEYRRDCFVDGTSVWILNAIEPFAVEGLKEIVNQLALELVDVMEFLELFRVLRSDFLDLGAGGSFWDGWLIAWVDRARVGCSWGDECIYCWGHDKSEFAVETAASSGGDRAGAGIDFLLGGDDGFVGRFSDDLGAGGIGEDLCEVFCGSG